MPWIFFALVSPFFYSVSNLFDRFIVEKKVKNTNSAAVLTGLTSILFVLPIIILSDRSGVSWTQIGILLFGGIASQIALIPWYKTISLDDLSRVIPVFQLIPVITLILSFLLLGEKLFPFQLAGFAVIFVGAYLLSLEDIRSNPFRFRKFLVPALFAILLFSLPNIMFKLAGSGETHFWLSYAYEISGTFLGTIITFLFLSRTGRRAVIDEGKKIPAKLWGIFLFNDLLYLAGIACGYVAVISAPVALVSVLGGTQNFYIFIETLILSVWFPKIIKEDTSRQVLILKVIAILFIFAGIWLINS